VTSEAPSLDQRVASTLAHYGERAEQFREGTWLHDVSQNLDALCEPIAAGGVHAPFRVLDFGCGPGRDLIALRQRGHAPTGLDGCGRFCVMAREASGCPVLHQSFLELALPERGYDGVFANASLFHVPLEALPRVLRQLRAALIPGGVLFASNPRGDGAEGWSGARWGVWHEPERWKQLVSAAGFELLREYYRPEGKPRDEQPWHATVWRSAS
jgi:SAM-dependent methyltransferase